LKAINQPDPLTKKKKKKKKKKRKKKKQTHKKKKKKKIKKQWLYKMFEKVWSIFCKPNTDLHVGWLSTYFAHQMSPLVAIYGIPRFITPFTYVK